jgi:hypothetical protein
MQIRACSVCWMPIMLDVMFAEIQRFRYVESRSSQSHRLLFAPVVGGQAIRQITEKYKVDRLAPSLMHRKH